MLLEVLTLWELPGSRDLDCIVIYDPDYTLSLPRYFECRRGFYGVGDRLVSIRELQMFYRSNYK